MAKESIVDYVQIVTDADDRYRVRGKSDGNGEIIWSTEKYGDYEWALAIARDSGKPIRDVDGKSIA